MSALMPLFWLAGVSNFCSNLLLSFLSIVCILSFQPISFQILLYAIFPQFPRLTLLPFPSYFNFHKLTYFGIYVSMHDMTITLQAALNDHILNLYNNTHPITKNISWQTINQSYPSHQPDYTTFHLTQPHLTVSSKVSQ